MVNLRVAPWRVYVLCIRRGSAGAGGPASADIVELLGFSVLS